MQNSFWDSLPPPRNGRVKVKSDDGDSSIAAEFTAEGKHETSQTAKGQHEISHTAKGQLEDFHIVKGQHVPLREIVKELSDDIVPKFEASMKRELETTVSKLQLWMKQTLISGTVSSIDGHIEINDQSFAQSRASFSKPTISPNAMRKSSESSSGLLCAEEANLVNLEDITPTVHVAVKKRQPPTFLVGDEEAQRIEELFKLQMLQSEDEVSRAKSSTSCSSYSLQSSPRKGRKMGHASTVDSTKVVDIEGREKSLSSELYELHEHDQSRFDLNDVLDAVTNGPVETLHGFLQEQLDPNLILKEVQLNDKSYHHCSLLAAAVLGGRPQNVRLLVDMKADLESSYGILTESANHVWIGPAIAAAIHSVTMTRTLLDLKADPAAEASNGANAIWQCSHFGRHESLQLLLTRGMPLEALSKFAEYQNQQYSPLHISVVMGQENCSRLLLRANAPVDTKNSKKESPLDTAIQFCRPAIVTLLIQEGAQIVEVVETTNRLSDHSLGSDESENSRGTNRISRLFQQVLPKPRLGVSKRCSGDLKPTVERAFEFRNPVVVQAMAIGLQSQPKQVAALSPDYVLGFCETDTCSMTAMMQALFVERSIRYKAKDAAKGVRERKTAIMPKAEIMKGKEDVYKHPIVVSSRYAYSDFTRLRRHPPDANMKQFIKELTPQKISDLRTGCCGGDHEHAAIVVYECLVPQIHQDIRFLKVLAEANEMNNIYTNSHCQALIAYAWSHARSLAALHFIVHFMILCFFMLCAAQKNYREWQALNIDVRDYLRWVACLISPCWLFEVITELIELAVHLEYGWIAQYIFDMGNLLDVIRVLSDGVVIFAFIIYGLDALDGLYFRCYMGAVCMLKWTKILYCLTPFRLFGLPLLPIIFTLRDIGPSVAIMILYYFGLAHALVILDILPQYYGFTILHSFFFAVGGDLEKVDALYEPHHDYNDFDSWLLQFLLAMALFAAPITFMNIFIAAMSSSFAHGIAHMEQLFQKRCVEGTFSHACVQYALRKKLRREPPKDEAAHRLWYCRDCSRSVAE